MKAAKLVRIGTCVTVLLAPSSFAQSTNTCPSALSSDFYSKYTVIQAVLYVQTNSAGPTLQGSNAYGFAASISLETNLSATAATLALPGQAAKPMKRASNQQFLLNALTNSFANLVAAYPDGTYQFAISNSSWSVTLPQGISLPTTPTLLNYQAAQNIDPTKDFPLMWQPMAGGTATDLITVDVRDSLGNNVLRTPKFGCTGDSDGTATSLLIPANSLTTNQTYKVSLVFVKTGELNTNSATHVALLSGTEAQNIITISTTAATQTSGIAITNLMLLGDQNIRFDLQTAPGANYTVQFNSDLTQTNGWTTLLSGTAATALTPVTNNAPVGTRTGFYRVF